MDEKLEVSCISKCTYTISFETKEEMEEWLEERSTNDMQLEYETEEWSDGQKEEYEHR